MLLVLVITQTFACMLPARTFLLHIRGLNRAERGESWSAIWSFIVGVRVYLCGK